MNCAPKNRQRMMGMRVTVTLDEKTYTIKNAEHQSSFHEIIEYIASTERKPVEDFEEIIFKCTGCQRRLWVSEADFQPIPATCCSVRSMMLESVKIQVPADASDESDKDITLTVSLPDIAPQSFTIPDSTSITELIKKASHNRPRFPIADVTLKSSGSIMIAREHWDQLTLAKCGSSNGEDLTIEAANPSSVYIMICEPHRSRPTDSAVLSVARGEWNWRTIRRKAQRHFKVAITPYSNACQFVRYYEGKGGRRRILWSYREEPEEELYFADEENAQEVDLRKAPHSALEVLAPASGLRWAPNTIPVIQVDTNCDFLRTTPGDAELEEFDPGDTVFHNKWLVLLLGLRFWSPSGWQTYIRIRGGLLFHQQSGTEFGDIEAVIKSRNRVPIASWRKFFLFLQNGDSVPLGKVPEGRTVAIYRREGLLLDVVDDDLVLKGASCEANESTWTVPTEQVEFDEKFMKAMRR